MKKLKFILPILLVIAMLFTACSTEDTDNGENNDQPKTPAYETVSLSEAIADYKTSPDDFKNYTLELTVRKVKDSTNGTLSTFDETGNVTVNMLFKKGDGGSRINYADLDTKPDAGDKIIVKANLKNQDGVLVIWRAELLSLTDGVLEADNLKKIRDYEDGTEVTASGTVAAITYSFGPTPSGVIIVDNSSSIYVYDKTIAAAVKVGNTITVEGTVGHWVLDDEKANAESFGYNGSCQIENATLIDNDGKITDFDKSWIEEISVKDLLDIPVTENITTKIYKVTALVKEVEGNGFTNFYFFDLDGTTGTYAYTQCSGADFAWVREFDGKFCTVYITPLNAKATNSDCYFRFLPVHIVDEGFTFDAKDAPEYAVKYHGLTQLKNSYSGDPALSLIGSVSSELLKFEGAILEYLSSDESIVKFTKTESGYVMNCPGYGTATVTVVATLGEYEYRGTLDITVTEPKEPDSVTPEEVILATENTDFTVKGIVGPSFVHVNRRGFYLIGESGGVIAISFSNADDLKDIEIGNTVIVSGSRLNVGDSMQIIIDKASLVVNFYGKKDIPESAFTESALGDIKPTQNGNTIFVATGTVGFVGTEYYSNYNLSGETLYSSDGKQQYDPILAEYKDQEITALLTVTNWNGKKYVLTLVGIITPDGTVYNDYSFAQVKK